MFFVKPFVKLFMLFVKLLFGKFNRGLDFSVKDRFIQKGGCEVGMMVASAEIVMFSLDPDHVLVEGDITGNAVFFCL